MFRSSLLILLLLFPQLSKAWHGLEHENDFHCKEKTQKHFHEEEHHCDVCDFVFDAGLDGSPDLWKINVHELPLANVVLTDPQRTVQPVLYYGLRAPPTI